MKIAVIGLWHLGSVTTACLSKVGYQVIAYDSNIDVVDKLKRGIAPIFEPNLENLLNEAYSNGNLEYTDNVSDITQAEFIWITFDTPIDDNDVADVNYIETQIIALKPYIQNNAVVLISSQIPVGTTHKILQDFSSENDSKKNICFAYIPENLRLGKAIDVFMNPKRIVVGLDDKNCTYKIQKFLKPFSENFIWMSIASAEMTKHAINSFLAMSVTFINELAALCESVGANGYEVEQGLKSEERIGPKAYLHPGDSIAGGTLLRDVNFLIELGLQKKQNTHLISAIAASNATHQKWTRHKLLNLYGDLKGKRIAVLGLTYKPDTNTLRRSVAIETCEWLFDQGCKIIAYDPSITTLPNEYSEIIQLENSYQNAIKSADAIIIATAWPQFCTLMPNELITDSNRTVVLIDPGGHLTTMKNEPHIHYCSVGYQHLPCR